MINESLLQICSECHSQTNLETNTRPPNNLNSRPAFLQTTNKACTTREARTRSRRCQFSSSIHDFSQEKIQMLKRLAQHDKRKSPSVMWRTSFPNKLRNEHTTTKQLEQYTRVFTDNKEGLHDTQSADSLTAGVRCQFLQNIHDFSQEKIQKLKRLSQHDKRKSPSVMWPISSPDKH